MLKTTPDLFPARPQHMGMHWGVRAFLLLFLCILLVWTDIFSGWTATPAHAATQPDPNPPLTAPSWLQPPTPVSPPDLGIYTTNQQNATLTPIPHAEVKMPTPVTVPLTTAAQQVLSQDNIFEVDVATDSVSTSQIQAAGGTISLKVSQTAAMSGGGSSGKLDLGTYQVDFLDAQGNLITDLALAHPFTFRYHLPQAQQSWLWQDQKIDAIWQPSASAQSALKAAAKTATSPAPVSPQLLVAQKDPTSPVWSVSTNLSVPSSTPATSTKPAATVNPTPTPLAVTPMATTNPTATPVVNVTPTPTTTTPSTSSAATPTATTNPTATPSAGITPTPTTNPTPTPTASVTPTPAPSPAPAVAFASSSIAFSTEAPTASWGKTKDVDVGLSSGSLTNSYPLSLPPGPGGLTPPLNLSYSSGSVNESHNVQGASSWVGQGWNLSLGSISWSQQNVTSGLGTTTLESSWNISDPNGLSGQLIPPDIKASTNGTLVPSMGSLPSQYIWHTAPESHAKIQEVDFNGQPCWHVWLPNGTIEEFGCVDEARQTAIDTNGVRNTYRWDLNLIVDRYGNQIRIHYQRNYPAGGSVRDAQISSVEYDDLSCHNIPFNGATAECSSWHPLIKIIFDATTKPARLTNATGCQNWTSTAYRCDDPVDLSSSGGLPIANALTTYVLNDLQVQVNGHVLRRYNFSYNQGGPQTITEVYSGQKESVAGYLTLTKIQQLGTDGATLNAPVTTMGYVEQTQHYLDIKTGANAIPSTNCGPAWTPRDGNGCFRWQQSYNSYYLSTIDNGMGWHAQMTWQEGHSNTHGVDSGAANNPFTCNGKQTITNWCGEADDMNWSRIVLTQRVELNNGVNSTWKYQYYLNGLSSKPCATCAWGNTWGNQNDVDAADYYNGQFTSYAETVVTNPDSTSQINYFASTPGWGLATSGITCYVPGGNCNVTPYWNEDPAAAGKLKTQENFNASGALMQVTQNQYTLNCPPAGVAGSQNAAGAPYDPGNHYLFSELDKNNPVVVCDPRISQQDTYQVDGVTNFAGYQSDARVVHKTVKTSYDGDNRGVGGYDYGNVNTVDTTSNDVGGQHFVQNTAYYPNDNINGLVYLTDLPAFVTNQDAAGTYFGCTALVYGNNASAPHAPNVPSVSQQIGYPNQSGGCAPPTISTQHTYNNSGNPIAATDADGHQGCTMNGAQYSACASYDGFQTHLTQALNAKNQAVNYHYDTSLASGGYGQWLLASSDANGQMTSYGYDVLGRLTSVVKPGDTANAPTVSYAYTNTCTVGITVPCLRLDTTTRVSGASTTTTRQWFDGMGQLVQTQTPGPNPSANVLVTYTIYDDLGRAITQSLPYAIANPTNAYVTPDLNQARTATRYDGLSRPIGSISYGPNAKIFTQSTITYTVARGVASFNVGTNIPFEQTITLDAYGHQSVQYTDALGRDRYEQVFDGTSSPYSVVRTVQYNQDEVGNVTSVVTYDNTSYGLVRTNATYDGLKRRIGFNDWDLGDCNRGPLLPSCSNTSDSAWKYTYDGDGNVLSQTDPRNVSTYTNYDVLDRPLCHGTAANQVNPCQSGAYATYFYDSYDNSSNPGVAFPSGCTAPGGTSVSVGEKVAETFSSVAGNGWRCYGYDVRGQTVASGLSVTADGQTTTQNVSMSYNDLGKMTSLTYPDGEIVASNYDSNGYFRGMSNSNGAIVSAVQYTNAGQLAGMTLGGMIFQGAPTTSVQTNFGYDEIQRPLSTSAAINGNPIFNQSRIYDNVGNVIGLDTTLPTMSGGSQTDNQSFCYDALNRLVWAGNSGTPSGGDHCGSTPGGTTDANYQQLLSYDVIDRFIAGPAGTTTYDPLHIHAATSVSSVPNQYASYDAMGNMTCRNIDTTTAHSCDASQTGATMTYDNEGRLTSWNAPSGTTESDQFLYDNEGNRVLQRASTTTGGTTAVTDTITFDHYTETKYSQWKSNNNQVLHCSWSVCCDDDWK